MAEINYIMNPTPVTVNANEAWGIQDVDGDGSNDGGNLPLSMTISPANASTHTVSAVNFNISGATYSETEEVGNGYTFLSTDSGVILPFGINKVKFFDTTTAGAVGNQVTVKCYIDPTYQISANNSTITLDIDGDADLIPQDSEPIQVVDDVVITNELQVGNVTLSLVNSVKSYSGPGGAGWNAGTPDGQLLDAGNANIGLGQLAVPTFMPNVSYQVAHPTDIVTGENLVELSGSGYTWLYVNTPTAPVYSSNVLANNTLYSDNFFHHTDFLLVPNEGYTLSRFNLAIEVSQTTHTPDAQASNYSQFPNAHNTRATNLDGSGLDPSTLSYYYGDIGKSIYWHPKLYFNTPNAAVDVTGSSYDAPNPGYSLATYQDGSDIMFPGYYPNFDASGDTSFRVEMFDTLNTVPTYNDCVQGFITSGTMTPNPGVLSSNFDLENNQVVSPSDWIGNNVLIRVWHLNRITVPLNSVGMGSYTTFDIYLPITGEPMALDGGEGSDPFSFDIEIE